MVYNSDSCDQPLFFIMLFVGIKVYRGSPWTWVDLSQADTVIESMRTLDRLRWRNTANEGGYNSWGWFERRINGAV